jgi:hypothetical protein
MDKQQVFFQFDFWNAKISKYCSGIFYKEDISSHDCLEDFARSKLPPEYRHDKTIVIKINALNLI